MADLETISKHYRELTEEEKKAAKKLEEDFSILSVMKGLSSEERIAVYRSIKRKIEYDNHFNALQRKWLEEHEVYVDEMLIKNNLDHSHEAISNIITKEILSGEGENVRCRIYYSLKYPENIEFPYNPEFSALLEEVRAVRRAN